MYLTFREYFQKYFREVFPGNIFRNISWEFLLTLVNLELTLRFGWSLNHEKIPRRARDYARGNFTSLCELILARCHSRGLPVNMTREYLVISSSTNPGVTSWFHLGKISSNSSENIQIFPWYSRDLVCWVIASMCGDRQKWKLKTIFSCNHGKTEQNRFKCVNLNL